MFMPSLSSLNKTKEAGLDTYRCPEHMVNHNIRMDPNLYFFFNNHRAHAYACFKKTNVTSIQKSSMEPCNTIQILFLLSPLIQVKFSFLIVNDNCPNMMTLEDLSSDTFPICIRTLIINMFVFLLYHDSGMRLLITNMRSLSDGTLVAMATSQEPSLHANMRTPDIAENVSK